MPGARTAMWSVTVDAAIRFTSRILFVTAQDVSAMVHPFDIELGDDGRLYVSCQSSPSCRRPAIRRPWRFTFPRLSPGEISCQAPSSHPAEGDGLASQPPGIGAVVVIGDV